MIWENINYDMNGRMAVYEVNTEVTQNTKSFDYIKSWLY